MFLIINQYIFWGLGLDFCRRSGLGINENNIVQRTLLKMLAKDNSVKKWSVALRGLTVCHVIFAWLNNYNIKPDENKEAKIIARQLLSLNHWLLDLSLDFSLNSLFIEPVYIKNPISCMQLMGLSFAELLIKYLKSSKPYTSA